MMYLTCWQIAVFEAVLLFSRPATTRTIHRRLLDLVSLEECNDLLYQLDELGLIRTQLDGDDIVWVSTEAWLAAKAAEADQ